MREQRSTCQCRGSEKNFMNCPTCAQKTYRVISSPSISTTGLSTLILEAILLDVESTLGNGALIRRSLSLRLFLVARSEWHGWGWVMHLHFSPLSLYEKKKRLFQFLTFFFLASSSSISILGLTSPAVHPCLRTSLLPWASLRLELTV